MIYLAALLGVDIVLSDEDPYTVDLGDGLEVTAAGAAAAAGQTGFAGLQAISQAMVQAAQAGPGAAPRGAAADDDKEPASTWVPTPKYGTVPPMAPVVTPGPLAKARLARLARAAAFETDSQKAMTMIAPEAMASDRRRGR